MQDQLRDINTPESLLQSKQIGETINAAMDALPDELRSAIVLREIDGLSYEEIAEAMSCPIGTVRSRIFRAREAVAEKLRPCSIPLPIVGGRSAWAIARNRRTGCANDACVTEAWTVVDGQEAP
jgi:predicted DNA-binding protein (UPF0251 family)